ncbi:MAG: hypothetical protein CMN77_19675 [Spirochaetaceae bacterium]|nr:hypothetical protein [Spirochaetaceae bacterium]
MIRNRAQRIQLHVAFHAAGSTCLFILFTLSSLSCIGFAYQEPRTAGISPPPISSDPSRLSDPASSDRSANGSRPLDPADGQMHNSASDRDGANTSRDRCTVHLDFVGWNYFPEDEKQVLLALQENGIRSNPESSFVLEITLEQTDITPLWRRLPNVIITVLTSSLFPLVEYFEYHVTFRLRSDARTEIFTRYRVMSHTILSGLVTPLTPFYYPPTARQDALAEAARDFAHRCRSFSD